MVIFSIESKLFTSDRSLEQDFESQSTALSLTWLEDICYKDEGEDEDTDDGDNDGDNNNNDDDEEEEEVEDYLE